MGMHLIAGRDFDARDEQHGLLDRDKRLTVAIANETFVKRYLQGGAQSGALGRHIGIGSDPGTPTPIEIVGVVSDSKYTSLREETQPQLFYPHTSGTYMVVYVRTTNAPTPMLQTLRAIVSQVEPALAIYGLQTFQTTVERSLVTERLVGGLSTVFGLLATLLAMIGLYGVMAYGVTRRTREIGLRMAMGAQNHQIAWLILREAATLLTAGIAIALPTASFASRYIESQLYGVEPSDPLVISTAVLVLIAVATTAAFIPARRATRVNPIIALRYE
jgi:hypothetical protein